MRYLCLGAQIGVKEFKDINWLPTKERFERCTAANVFKFFDNAAPSYMSETLLSAGKIRVTRRSKDKLDKPFRKSNTGQKGLSHLEPKIWNTLNSDFRDFKDLSSIL